MAIGNRILRHARPLAALLLLAGMAPAPAPARLAGLEKVQALAGRGRPEEALRRLDKILARDPELTGGRLLRGVLLVELGRQSEAEKAFRDLAERDPQRPEPVNNLAVLQAAAGRTEAAVGALEELVGRYPDYDAAAANLETLRGTTAGEGGEPAIGSGPAPRLILTAELGAYAPTPTATAPEETAAPVVVTAPRRPATQPPAAKPSAAPAAEAAAAQPVPAPAPAPAEAPEPMPKTAPAPPAAASAGPAAADLRSELADVIEAWAAAWAEQRVREYLAFYAADFEPTGYPSRQAWEATRRQRVAAPSFIEVEIDLESMTVRETGPGAASATFVQRYRSDRFGDTVSKTLDLVREAGAWRIRRETSG